MEGTARKSSKRRYLTLDNKQDKKLTVDYKEIMRECKLQHAWARTIHTFQVLICTMTLNHFSYSSSMLF